MAYETVRNFIVAILGDRLISSVGRQDCRRVMETLHRLPSNFRKRWPDMTPEAIAEMAQREGLRPMSAANCNGYMTRWSGMMNWLVKEELASRNPCIGLRVADPVPVREKRLPFSPGQLQRIFSGEPFHDLKAISEGRADPMTPSAFYVPLIALFSGLRQNEICQQTIDDIVEIDGVFAFVVQPDRELGKRVKTTSSERLVPVHPVLVRARLLDHWRACKAAEQRRLWSELELDRFGYASANFSKWFARYLLKTGAKQDRTAFHSFRHFGKASVDAAGDGHPQADPVGCTNFRNSRRSRFRPLVLARCAVQAPAVSGGLKPAGALLSNRQCSRPARHSVCVNGSVR
ncbi:site-specific integrase [Parafrankia sp. BMG5.11]|uniref:site-specific integrase n=1 Tax=Parafrankia sp. BMG5.11 TaxID=222540 RepID=UPI00103BC56C|nr:site-specific integrase [Parafrankia sp. BMG5.11]TCJ41167.1 site-specific integrase [Parafrankia sp. BMG5.11]